MFLKGLFYMSISVEDQTLLTLWDDATSWNEIKLDETNVVGEKFYYFY